MCHQNQNQVIEYTFEQLGELYVFKHFHRHFFYPKNPLKDYNVMVRREWN